MFIVITLTPTPFPMILFLEISVMNLSLAISNIDALITIFTFDLSMASFSMWTLDVLGPILKPGVFLQHKGETSSRINQS